MSNRYLYAEHIYATVKRCVKRDLNICASRKHFAFPTNVICGGRDNLRIRPTSERSLVGPSCKKEN